ncbi:MAG: peptidase S8 [Candidatus Doudnabacteria bacterium]|nr:peptidase S8 [Candidatus Doudnabacteria bacterium]
MSLNFQAKAEVDSFEVIFAVNEAASVQGLKSDYELKDAHLIYEARGPLRQTYKAYIDAPSFQAIKLDPRIAYVEFDAAVSAALINRNDPLFTLDELQEDRQWYLPKIKIPQAWEFGQGSGTTTVAIIDTGIHATHLELNDGRIAEGYNTVTNQVIPAQTNSDDNGHGTAVAGIIGAISDNGKGIAGVNKNVKIMPIKALSSDGTGSISAVASGIVWAADHGAHIINLSLGGPGFGADQTLNNAITYAFNKGVLIVSAAGNDLAASGQNLDTAPVYPVCSDNGANMVLGVAATDVTDKKASFSNFGINCIDISAPGKKILTTAFLPSDPSDNVLIYGSGTSLATPVVSGVAALIKSAHPEFTNLNLRSVLLASTDNIDALNQNNCLNSSCNGFLGKGRINAYKAMAPQVISEGSLVRSSTGDIYLITGGIRRLVSGFVFNQRGFASSSVTNEVSGQLAAIPLGDPLPPLEGTLIKSQSDATVYVIHQELRRPLTYLVFTSRSFSFSSVITLTDSEVAYVMHREVRRPVTYFVFIQRKLSFAKVVKVTVDEFSHIPQAPDSYWLSPLEGTLVKSVSDSTVYVIENETKRALSYQAFISRGYKFSSIKTLPQAEMDVVAPGGPIL